MLVFYSHEVIVAGMEVNDPLLIAKAAADLRRDPLCAMLFSFLRSQLRPLASVESVVVLSAKLIWARFRME